MLGRLRRQSPGWVKGSSLLYLDVPNCYSIYTPRPATDDGAMQRSKDETYKLYRIIACVAIPGPRRGRGPRSPRGGAGGARSGRCAPLCPRWGVGRDPRGPACRCAAAGRGGGGAGVAVRSVDPMAHVGGWISAYPQQTERRRDSPAEASRRQRQSPDSSRAHGRGSGRERSLGAVQTPLTPFPP